MGSGCGWIDYAQNGLLDFYLVNGRLDLVIANYVDWSPQRNFYCGDRGPAIRSYCTRMIFTASLPCSITTMATEPLLT